MIGSASDKSLQFLDSNINLLNKAIQLDSHYSEAFSYLSLYELDKAILLFSKDQEKETQEILRTAMLHSNEALKYDEKNELALNINTIIPIAESFLKCTDIENYEVELLELRNMMFNIKTLMYYYPESPLTYLMQSVYYYIKSSSPIASNEDEKQQLDYMKKTYEKSKEVLEYYPNDPVMYNINYISTMLLVDHYRTERQYIKASNIASTFLDFSEDQNRLDNMFP